ncbi:hypothetical protein [Brevibacillus massiliensis]|jgi:hypothetical protein|uniref:hypothetical protein n=1 Tax=Brevibacillus massiliensis TaxID=1118054 RepID=UPI000367FC63|nr:hypothetical protein [Brevibacillus massiliensis]
MARERLLVYYAFTQPSSQPGTFGPVSLVAGPNPAEMQLAEITLRRIRPHDRVELASTVGWRGFFGNPVVEFRIRRGGINGPVVFSNRDTGATDGTTFDFTTTFDHAEKGLSSSIQTYVLTVRLIQSLSPAGNVPVQIIGPVHFEGSVIDDNPR